MGFVTGKERRRFAALGLVSIAERRRFAALGFYLSPQQAAYYSAASTGSATNAAGQTVYDPAQNQMLTQQTATTDINGAEITQQITPTATTAGAQQIAAAIGGAVVPLPNATTWTTSAPQLGIQMPDGRILDAGAVAAVIGNNAAYPSAAIKAGEIAKMVDTRYQPVAGDNFVGAQTAPAAVQAARSAATGAGASGAAAPGATGAAAWLTSSIVPGVPNWSLAAAAAAVFMLR